MKILFFSFYYKPDLCAGSFRSSALVEELKNHKDIELEIVTTMPNRYSTFNAVAYDVEQKGNVRIHRISLPSHNSGMLDQVKAFIIYYLKARRIASKNHYDIVFATSSRLFTAFLGARVARKKKIPLYLDIRDIFLDTIGDIFSTKTLFIIKPIVSLVEKYAFNKAKHINLVSEGFEDYFLNKFKCHRYSYFTNGVDKEFLKDFKPLNIPSSGKLKILYAGNIGEGQGLHRIIPYLARKISNNFEFLIIGDGGRKQELINSVEGLNNVKIIPPVNRKELIVHYSDADVFFLHLNDYPAFEKVLPSKIFEYVALGKPILAGVAGYAADFLNQEVDNVAVFLPLDSEDALLKLNTLTLATTDRVKFVQKYSRQAIMKKMSQTIIDIYDGGSCHKTL